MEGTKKVHNFVARNIKNEYYYEKVYLFFNYGSSCHEYQCTNSQEVDNYTDKLLRYELNPGNGDFSYLQKALYTQSDDIQESHVQDTIAAQLLQT